MQNSSEPGLKVHLSLSGKAEVQGRQRPPSPPVLDPSTALPYASFPPQDLRSNESLSMAATEISHASARCDQFTRAPGPSSPRCGCQTHCAAIAQGAALAALAAVPRQLWGDLRGIASTAGVCWANRNGHGAAPRPADRHQCCLHGLCTNQTPSWHWLHKGCTC